MVRQYSLLFSAWVALLVGGACSGNDRADCVVGAERCSCYRNGTCDTGLTCASNLCVALDTAGTGGGLPGSAGASAGDPSSQGGASTQGMARGPCVQVGFIGDDVSDGTPTPEQFIEWMEGGGATVTRIAATAPLTAEMLEPLHLVVVGNMAGRADVGWAYSEDDVDHLRAWVEGGGGLVTLAGYNANELAVQPADLLLEPLGVGYDYVGRGAGVLGEGEPPVVTTGIVGGDHSVVAGVSSLGVYFAYPVVGDGTALVEEAGFVLAMAKEVGRGHVFAYGDEYSTFAGEWSDHPDLQHEKLWTNVVRWLLSGSDCSFPG